MKLPVIFLCCLLFLTVGCSSPSTVHLYGKFLKQAEIDKIKNSLTQAEMLVEVNRLPFPNTIGDNTLIYAPSKGSKQQAEKVMNLLNQLGIVIDNTGLILASNHSFSANNMGLYIVPDDIVARNAIHIEQEYDIPLFNEYAARDCQNSTTLILQKNGQFRIEEDIWDASKKLYNEHVFKGIWHLKEEKFIFLDSPKIDYTLIFERTAFSRKINGGELQGYQLIPMTSYNKKSNAGRLYCTYEISQVL
ncbi:hypothetical protein Q4489_14780 [Thalassotalea sp. 1_MG-2023]|uniref:hypothetical protein n=1 Tax=Thalassotalea sp. 1_MG-2023 TaxID=3062680 RepID=UPI0026E17227|nr:hypothetical protein [Thalassotalea sp. 1_MG-2023]MDO6428283.1 hypothetical protein [Thalassotalea sp. 1_MG-2023]